MANKQHAQFSDENGNIYYLENQTEDVLDPSGKPLSDGGDLSEASVTFTADSTRTLPKSGSRFKAFCGSVLKFLSDLKAVSFSGSYNDLSNKPSIPSGAAASQAVANNCTTTAAGSVLDARQGKVLMDKANQLSSDFQDWFGVTEDGQRGWKEQGADTVYPFLKTVEIAGSVSLEKVGTPNDDRAYARIDAPDGFEISQIIYSSSGFSTDMYYNFNVGGTAIGNQERSNVTNRKLDISSAQDRSFLQVLIRQYGEHASGTGSVNYTIQFERKAG